MALMPLQTLERDVDHVRRVGHQEITTHNVAYGNVLLLTCERREQVRPRQNADDCRVVHDRKILLRTGQQQIDGTRK
ncbi:MAG: hypothetical protein EWM73_02595 [Nitrospira sp.]|nr:MAG: hypothetical protein EWM73_02595 [Nitrospira sp.]